MDIDKLTIGEAKELACLIGAPKKTCCKDGGVKIVVLQRGWVAVGYFSQEGTQCKLDNAAIIRNWGTTKGQVDQT